MKNGNYYEFITHDSCGNAWNWEDDDANVVIEAPDSETAMRILLDSVDSEFESAAAEYYPRLIDDITEYMETHYSVEWGV